MTDHGPASVLSGCSFLLLVLLDSCSSRPSVRGLGAARIWGGRTWCATWHPVSTSTPAGRPAVDPKKSVRSGPSRSLISGPTGSPSAKPTPVENRPAKRSLFLSLLVLASSFGLSAYAHAGQAPFHRDLRELGAELERARGPEVYATLRRIWNTWDRAD